MVVMTTPQDPQVLLRSKSYLRLLILAALLGVPVSAAAYGFLALVAYLQPEVFTHLPNGLGFHGAPPWWPLPVLAVAGLLVAPVIRFLPGKGGHSPADGFKPGGGAPTPAQLPGVLLASLATLSLGVVLGPEAPLIALGGGLAVLAVRLARRDLPAQATAVVAAAGSFAAVSTLLGSPIAGAFLLMEAAGLGGAMMGVVLLPGLLASGVGALIFVGLDSLTGLGTFSLSIPGLPHFARPDVAEFGWALVIGVAAAILGTAIQRLALLIRPHIERRLLLLLTPVVGLLIAGLTIAYTEGTGHSYSDVLFSGQSQLGPLITHAAGYSVGALLLLLACKGLAYSASLSSFRGGPTFPSLYLGAAGGIALSHLPGLPLVPGVAMGIGAMCAVMLRLPLTSVLLATLLLFSDGLAVTPLVIVAVVVAHMTAARLTPAPAPAASPAPAAAAPAAAGAARVPPQAPAAEPIPPRVPHSSPPDQGTGPASVPGPVTAAPPSVPPQASAPGPATPPARRAGSPDDRPGPKGTP
jgi:H+/Cl- antiporter ClcA